MKKKLSYLLLASTVLFSACSTDLEVIGNYKETMVVYGLLDQGQSKQYIKINKAFLGEGNAIGYAQIKDSVQFVNSLSVRLIRLSDGSEYNLLPDNLIQKDAGTFYAPDQSNAIYSFSTPITASPNTSTAYLYDSNYVNTSLPSNSDYKLIIKNNETGIEISSQTSLVNDFTFTSPPQGPPTFSFYSATNPVRFKPTWTSSKNGRAYQLVIRFNYVDSTVTGNIAQHLDYVFPERKTEGLTGNESMGEDILGEEFISFIGSQLCNTCYSVPGYNPALYKRIAGKVDLMVVAAGDDLNTFMEVNKPSTGIIQQKLEFTNITNGLGIFSTRYNKPPFSRPFNASTLTFLKTGKYTNNLRF